MIQKNKMLHLIFKDLDELIEKEIDDTTGLIYNPRMLDRILEFTKGFDEYSYFFRESGNYTIIPYKTNMEPEKFLNYLSKQYNFQYCCNHGEEAHKFGIKTTDAKRVTRELIKIEKERIENEERFRR